MSKDENDRAQEGSLPKNPKQDARRVNDTPRLLTVQELLSGSMNRATKKETIAKCVTGVHEIDDATGGLRPGDVWVIGGDTNIGKSCLLVQIADENLLLGKGVLIVAAEDKSTLYGDRLMRRRARVSAKRLKDRCLTAEELSSVAATVARAEKVPVYLDARGRPAEWVAKHVSRVVEEESIDVVLYDYIQEFRSVRQYGTRTLELEAVGGILRHAVKRRDKAGIIFSQITVTEQKLMPDKHSIRNCRDISNAAEGVMLMWQPKTDIEKDGLTQISKGTTCIFVDKVKDGTKGFVVPLSWDTECWCYNRSRDGEKEADWIAPDEPDHPLDHDLPPDYKQAAAGG